MTVAFFDDFTDTVLGHHPDFTVGLANAAPTVTGPESVRLYCPPVYLDECPLRDGVVHRPTVGRSPGSVGVKLSYSRLVDPANLAAASRDAAAHGASVFLNCYLDENYAAWPAPQTGLRYVHSLHRPGYFGLQVADHLGRRSLGRTAG